MKRAAAIHEKWNSCMGITHAASVAVMTLGSGYGVSFRLKIMEVILVVVQQVYCSAKLKCCES